jgi:hypothetical protein
MNRYEKVVENGITVYRSKVPVRVENYYPSTVAPAAPSSTMTERLPHAAKQEDPYLLCRKANKPREDLPSNKENLSGSDKPTARVLARFVPK